MDQLVYSDSEYNLATEHLDSTNTAAQAVLLWPLYAFQHEWYFQWDHHHPPNRSRSALIVDFVWAWRMFKSLETLDHCEIIRGFGYVIDKYPVCVTILLCWHSRFDSYSTTVLSEAWVNNGPITEKSTIGIKYQLKNVAGIADMSCEEQLCEHS